MNDPNLEKEEQLLQEFLDRLRDTIKGKEKKQMTLNSEELDDMLNMVKEEGEETIDRILKLFEKRVMGS